MAALTRETLTSLLGIPAEAPAEAVRAAMEAAAGAIGFAIERMNAEALGLCPACAGAGK